MMAKKLLGDAVKEERLRRNLSQNALAEMVHVSLRTISDIENYNGNPRFENLYLLASYLNLSIDAVFNGENEPMDSTMKQIIAELNQCSNDVFVSIPRSLMLFRRSVTKSCTILSVIRSTLSS